MRNINADVNKIKGQLDRMPSLCVGAGRAAEVLRKDFSRQMETVTRECGFQYLRFHGIFHDEMGAYSEDDRGNPIYNWQYLELVYDDILDKGMKPFVEIGFMPGALASGDRTVFWWKSNVTPPKDSGKWYNLVKNFVQHLEDRYGREEVCTWFFEIWNEPNHPAFFTGTMKEYFELYDVSARAVKSVCGSYRTGGPATAGSEWIGEFIAYCHTNRVPVDFISTHTYGVSFRFDESGTKQMVLMDPMTHIIREVKAVREKVKASSMPGLEIHYTEWSSSCSARDPVHDSYIGAPYILYCLKRLQGCVNSMSYWTFTDIFEEVGIPPAPLHGGFGLINLQSLRKPAFYAYSYFHQLGDQELENGDPDSWVCRDDRGVQALIWNYTFYKQDTCNKTFFSRDLRPGEAAPVRLAVNGLKKGRYLFEGFHTGYGRNDLYTHYTEIGPPDSLSKIHTEYLKGKTDNQPVISEYIEVEDSGCFDYQIPMRENDVYLLKLTAERDN